MPEPFSPQTLNRYSYVVNDPVNKVDPSGNISEAFGGTNTSGIVIERIDSGPSVSSGGSIARFEGAATFAAFRAQGFEDELLGRLSGDGRSRRGTFVLPAGFGAGSLAGGSEGRRRSSQGGIASTIADVASVAAFVPGLNVPATAVEVGARLFAGDASGAFEASIGFIPGGRIARGVGSTAITATRSGLRPTISSVLKKIDRGVRSADELDAIKRPLDIRPVRVDELGRRSQRFVGRRAEVVVNPDTGAIPSVNPTSTKKAQRLLRQLGLTE